MARQLTTYTVDGSDVVCWCDIAQVSLMTGKTVTEAQMVQAQMVIEGYTECFADQPPITIYPRDLRWLQDALVYQAAWMSDRLDNFDNVDVTSVSQDGASVTFAHPNANKIAPYAGEAIRKLTWMRTGRISVTKDPNARRYANWQEIEQAFLRDEAPGDGVWQTAGPGGLA